MDPNAAAREFEDMKNLSLSLLSIWSWLVLALCLLLWLPLMSIVLVLTAPFDRPRYWTGYLFRKLTVVHLLLNPLWKFRTAGAFPADPRRPYVVVSNHESFVDILLISQLPWEMKWLSKYELFKLPIIGWLMRMANDIPVDRRDPASAVAAMAKCRRMLDQHVSVMIFPEGRRSTSGELLPFRDGAFRLAIEAQVPILPLAVHGAAAALRTHSWRFGRAVARVQVLAPISTAGMTMDDVATLRERSRDAISTAIAELMAT